MANAERGEKRRCLSCSTPFFDLNHAPIVCPKCAAVFQVVEIVRSAPKRAPFRMAAVQRPAVANTVAVDAILLIDEEEAMEIAIAPAEGDDEIQEIKPTI